MSDYLTEDEYGNLRAALEDAERVALDVVDLVEGTEALLVPAQDLAFLGRRLQQLVRACLDAEALTRTTPPPAERGLR